MKKYNSNSELVAVGYFITLKNNKNAILIDRTRV